mmetsp:Transcript_142261/g.265131  ORF Transcript_142261/g.265131 Transcript_142261/m.265131 type:complete len:204 (+) Transcript_142261:44-655(+)
MASLFIPHIYKDGLTIQVAAVQRGQCHLGPLLVPVKDLARCAVDLHVLYITSFCHVVFQLLPGNTLCQVAHIHLAPHFLTLAKTLAKGLAKALTTTLASTLATLLATALAAALVGIRFLHHIHSLFVSFSLAFGFRRLSLSLLSQILLGLGMTFCLLLLMKSFSLCLCLLLNFSASCVLLVFLLSLPSFLLCVLAQLWLFGIF